MARAHDLAAYILAKQGSMTAMKLQKLCYYSQAYSLAWFDEPIFDEPIKAWTNGPVIPALWQSHRGQFMVDDIPTGNAFQLTDRDRAVVDAVLDAMGGLSGMQLSDRTHSEKPWIDRYDGDDNFPDGVITHDDLRSFYGNRSAVGSA